jgi:pimeloyl-ACP methyl ester carboxylesterase
MYPHDTDQLVLVDPIGLEDWKAKGVPWQSVDAWYQRELNTTAERIRDYERTTYYAGTWKPEYEPWVEMFAGQYRGPGHEIVAWNSALLYDMIFTQPVFYELDRLAVPVLLMIGDKDTTAIGKELAPPEIRATLGNYPALGKAARASRVRISSNSPSSATRRRSRHRTRSTKRCSTACAATARRRDSRGRTPSATPPQAGRNAGLQRHSESLGHPRRER